MNMRQRTGDSAYHHGDLRNACLTAALRLLKERGLEGVTLREVAHRIGVSRSAPYRHFSCKRDLLAACATQGFVALAARTQTLLDGYRVPDVDTLRVLLRGYADFGTNEPELYRLMFAGDFKNDEYPELTRKARQVFASLEEAVRHGQTGRRIASGATGARVLTLWSLVHGLVTLDNDLAPSEVVDAATLTARVDAVFDTIAPAFAVSGRD